MGMIIPNVQTDSSTAFDSNIAVLSPATERPAGGPDASLLGRADFPQRDVPAVSGSREARFQTVFRQSVLDEIHAHGKSSMEAEVCGVLIGNIYSDRMASWAYVEHVIRGNNAVGKQTQVTITSETWSRIHETLDAKYPGKKIIGWYHTHPGFGIFLSGMDLFIQDNFFNQPWQIATVYDPHSEDEGTFIWRGGKSVRETALVENDTGNSPQFAEAMAAVDKLARRVKQLERRIDFILTGFLFLVLLALVVPLVLVALGPDAIRKMPILHPNSPAATPPANAPTAPSASQGPAKKAALDATTTVPTASADPATKTPVAAPVDVAAQGPILLKSGSKDEVTAGGGKVLIPSKSATH